MMGNAEQNVVMLPSNLDQAAAESFLELMRHRVSGDAPLALDASEVETLTLPCTQIVLAALRVGESIKIRNPSAAFVASFEDFGLDWQSHLDQSQISEEIADQQEITGEAPDAPPAEATPDVDAETPPISEKVMSKRILTIDDSKTIRDMLMLTLAEAGFDVIQAVDGQDGLDVLAKEQSEVDVIITDINMPRMDGYEVIRNLRRDPTYKSKPILVLTTESDGDKKNLAREAGATGWMVKPFDPERLVATVRKVAP
ncbi:MAG: response regulator [Proteobacteria bacterium]|nr:response regulator [Pseudomonadota bacterium]